MERKHLSLHIEKNAGTTVQKYLEKMYGEREVLMYDAGKDRLCRVCDWGVSRTNQSLHTIREMLGRSFLWPMVYKIYVLYTEKKSEGEWFSPDDLPGDFMAIHGHYELGQFVSKVGDHRKSVLFREPLERMVSQYCHWRRNNGSRGWRVNVPYDAKMGITEYVFRPEFRNYQSRVLSGRLIDDFDVVGVVERIGDFIETLGVESGWQGEHLNKARGKRDYEQLGVDKDFIGRFREYNAEDYENYRRVCEMVGVDR